MSGKVHTFSTILTKNIFIVKTLPNILLETEEYKA